MDEITTTPRAQLSLRLIGGPEGAIPLARLAAVAELQQAVLRLAKGIEGRAGRRGRSPQPVEDLTRLFAVAIRAGSAVLELEAPALTGQLPLADVGLEAFDLLEDTLEAAGQGRSLPEGVDDWSREKIGAFLEELVDYQRVTIEYRRGAAVREVSVAPVSALDAFRPARGLPSGTSTELNGLLYEVNIKSGSFRLEDDLGRIHYLKFDTSGTNLDRVRELIGRRVNAQGTMSLDAGRNERFEATKLSLAEPLPQHSFFDFDVDAVLRRTGPVVSVQSLAIEEFDEDEADGFWRAITD